MDNYQAQSHPMVANEHQMSAASGCPWQEGFDRSCLVDGYTISPDWSLDTLFDFDSSDHPVNFVESPTFPKSSTWLPFEAPTTVGTINTNASLIALQSVPIGYISDVDFDKNSSGNALPTVAPTSMSSHQASSPTSERSSEGFSIKRSFSSSPAHRSTKCELLDSIPKDDEFAQKQAQRKRGRPRLDRGALTATERTATSRNARCQRLPHNQVERKYREGLNAELEKLRRAVPTLTQHNPTDMTTLPRPSKATVLACAVEYIKKVEIERDFLRVENETLRGLRPSIAEV